MVTLMNLEDVREKLGKLVLDLQIQSSLKQFRLGRLILASQVIRSHVKT